MDGLYLHQWAISVDPFDGSIRTNISFFTVCDTIIPVCGCLPHFSFSSPDNITQY